MGGKISGRKLRIDPNVLIIPHFHWQGCITSAVRSFFSFIIATALLCAADGPRPSSIADAEIRTIEPGPVRSTGLGTSEGVDWAGLWKTSLRFLTVEHSFRWATEPGTRADGIGWGRGYLQSVGSLHGWADGDPFYVNYVGHPMQGSVAGRIWQRNDPRFRSVRFGRDPQYWKSVLRSAAFAWVYSEQFEIGPLSEASIGHIQRTYPQRGFVDHVVTPTFGAGWLIAEDALDRFVVEKLEARVANPWVRLIARSWLNPTRSFGNVLSGKVPWYRDSRPGVLVREWRREVPSLEPVEHGSHPAAAPFEFGVTYQSWGSCQGGGASAAYRLAPEWMLALDVAGCSLGRTGDKLTYLLGPRWTPAAASRWSPYIEVKAGGAKLVREDEEANRFAVAAGTGLDLKLNNALALRVASVEYLHAPSRSVQVSTGMVLRIGSW